jgi:hypothetical protein
VAATAFADADDQARAWLAPFATAPADVVALDHRHCLPTTIDGLLYGMDGLFPPARRYASDQAWTRVPKHPSSCCSCLR